MRTWVYKHYSASGEVLYIGVSKDPLLRTCNHLQTATWFDQVARIELEKFEDRDSALAAEGRLILELRPAHNRLAIVDGLVQRVSYPEDRRNRYMEIRDEMCTVINSLGIKQASKTLLMSELTLHNILTNDTYTAQETTISQFNAYKESFK